MANTTKVNELTSIGNIADADKLVGERVDGTTVRITFNGVLYDADFTSNGIMARTAAATYANRTMTGTSDRLSITNGDGVSGNPTFDISTSYVGQATITTLGTISTGVWNGTVLTVPYGGTGIATTTAYAPICGGTTATGVWQTAGTGSAGQLFVSTGASSLPAWTTPTYPTTSATSGKIIVSNGTNFVASTPTFPNASATSLKYIRSDGTNWIASTSTLPDSYVQGDLLYSSAADVISALAKDANSTRYLSNQGTSNNPSWNQVNLANGVTGTLPVANGGTGVTASDPVIQRVGTQTGAVASGTTVMPLDDTIPQSAEGDQYLSQAITPKNTANILVIEVRLQVSSSIVGFVSAGIFQDATAGALASMADGVGSAGINILGFRHTMTAGTTSSTTFKVRAGLSAAGTLTINGSGGARLHGGVLATSLSITEYAT